MAKVAVDQAIYHYDKPYDYLLPFDVLDKAKPGCRVLVPFGRGNRKRQGVILSVSDTGDYDKLKPIAALLDDEPMLTDEMLKLAVWMKEQTFCTYFDALKVLLPAGINLRMVASYRINPKLTLEDIEELEPDERAVSGHLYNSKAVVERNRLLTVMGLSNDSTLLENLVKKGIIIRTDDAVRRMGDATVKMVRLTDPGMDLSVIKLTSKQKSVIELLVDAVAASVKEICYFTGVTSAVINALEKKSVVELFDHEIYRTPVDTAAVGDNKEIALTKEQDEAFHCLLEQYHKNTGGVSLLYGVTGSGKTQVFLKLVDEVSAAGRGVIVMVPEIALTPQTLGIFVNRYGGRVAIFHSAMALGQRMDEWKRVKNGDAVIAIGTRSAIFAPFKDLGLIIMDEEQEHTYKSESSPRFHARDVARFRTAYHKSQLILASATPAIESYTAAVSGRYNLCKLSNRYGSAVLPDVVTVDMREELARGNTGALSAYLIDKLKETLCEKKQAILLLNRRGHNTYVSCRSCGYVATCPNCSISMTFHSANSRLMCHYCGFSDEYATVCPECGNEHMRYSGLGTQKAEQELSAMFPDARILRMDADSTMSRDSYEKNLSAFAAGEYDIMLGTQMVAKGLDFPAVTLVGVLGADQSMYSDDYRSFERSFSLLTQVVGRSGRGDNKGVAAIQTINPESSVIRLAEAQDYEAFYEQEIMTRKLMIYPPYCDLSLVGFVSEDKELAEQTAGKFFNIIKTYTNSEFADVKLIILGPSAASVPKVSGRYRYRMIIKCRMNARFRAMMKAALIRIGKENTGKQVTVYTDMNPDGIL